MIVLATKNKSFQHTIQAILESEKIDVRWEWLPEQGAHLLDVPTSDAERVSFMLSEDRLYAIKLRPPHTEKLVPVHEQPAFASAVGLASLFVALYYITGPSHLHHPWVDVGVLSRDAFFSGQWWRVVTAACLHADLGHVLGNALFFTILGWGLSERIGPGFMWSIWLLSAVAGFGLSLSTSEILRTLGASGGNFGLLGAIAGHRVHWHQDPLSSKRSFMRYAGASLMLLAFTAFDPQSNVRAHVGGFLSGFAMGAILPEKTPTLSVQVLASSLTTFVLIGAWMWGLP
jgi:rhomboid protease GluP